MTQPPSDSTTVVAIRAATARDADSIARVFLDSAAYHASLDPERYWVPDVASIAERYREGRQHPPEPGVPAVTLVAEVAGELLGFVDARIERSQDLMHRDMTYCHVSEIAVGKRHQSQGIGGQLLRAAEAWGRQHSAAFASLEHHIANTRAGAFYAGRMGYSVAATILIKSLQTTA
jgi:ribosomal protein S18 acetylase RimI-like enzyme